MARKGSPYDDESLFEGMREEAKNYTEKVGGDRPTTPLMFLDEGTYTMRIWPDLYTSPNDGRKKLRAARIINMHNLGKDMGGRVPCEGENCRVCKEVHKLEDVKYGKAWQFKNREEGVITGYIYKTNAEESKYLKLKEASYIILSPRVFISFQTFIAGLDREDLRQVMNPEVEAKGLKLTFTGGNKGSASWGFDLRDYDLPELPVDFEDHPISLVYYDENEPSKSYISDDDLAKFRKFVARLMSERGTAFDPGDDDRGSRSRGRDDDDRGSRDRGDRSSRDDDRGSRGRDDDRGASRSRGRGDDDRGRGDDDDRGSRGRDRNDDRPPPRDSGRAETRSDRGRDDDTRGRGRDDDDDRGSRGRDSARDDDRGSSRRSTRSEDDGGSRGRGRDDKEDKGGGDNKPNSRRVTIPIHECPSTDKDLEFGKNPEVISGGDMHPDCITCAHESECQTATREANFDDVPH